MFRISCRQQIYNYGFIGVQKRVHRVGLVKRDATPNRESLEGNIAVWKA